MAHETSPHGRHLTDELLVQFFESDVFGGAREGAVGSGEARRHLDGCQVCRERLSRMRDAVSSFTEYRDDCYSAERRPPPGRWLSFQSKLAAQVRGQNRKAARHVKSRVAPFVPRLRWVAGLAASITLIALVLFYPNQAVSASEALQRSEGAERRAGGFPKPLIYRKIRVESPAGAAEWEVWSAPSERRVHDRWAGRRDIGATLDAVYRQNHLNAGSSLSASGYEQWRKANQPAKDGVSVDHNRGLVTVTTTRQEPVQTGEIIQATLVMRKSDWHAVGEGFRVRAGQVDTEYWLRELEYRIAAFTDEAWAAVVDSVAETRPMAPVAPVSAADETPQKVDPDPDQSELRVLAALRKQDIDTAADFEIRADRDAVQVQAYAVDAEDRAKITSALAGIPGVRVQFPAGRRNPPAREDIYRDSGAALPPLMLRQLVLALGSEQAAGDRVAQINAAFADARLHALALGRLGKRNAQRQNAWTTRPDLRPIAEALARDHAGRIAKRIDEIRQAVQPLLNSPPPKPSGQGCRVWSGALSSLAERVSDAQKVSDRLFSVTSTAAGADVKAGAGEFAAMLGEIWNLTEECAN